MNDELNYLNDNGFFNVEGFMSYLEEQFPEPMKYPFTRTLIESIMNIAAAEFDYETGQFCMCLSSHIPELGYDEVAKFANPLMLND